MELKDYLHLYLGCNVTTSLGVFTLIGVEGDSVILINKTHGRKIYSPKTIKPILRPLSDMTEEENKEWNKLVKMETEDFLCGLKSAITQFAEGTKYLLSRHFDLFNLIEHGLAIDSTTLKETIK